MSAKRSEPELPASSQKIQRARAKLKQTSKLRKLELMVEAGVMTEKQAERARKRLAENTE